MSYKLGVISVGSLLSSLKSGSSSAHRSSRASSQARARLDKHMSRSRIKLLASRIRSIHEPRVFLTALMNRMKTGYGRI
jgi:hypothetical protein